VHQFSAYTPSPLTEEGWGKGELKLITAILIPQSNPARRLENYLRSQKTLIWNIVPQHTDTKENIYGCAFQNKKNIMLTGFLGKKL
jgi:hypothetical protein